MADLPRLEIAWLPTDSPWLNPIEKLWRWLPQDVLTLHRLADDWPTTGTRCGSASTPSWISLLRARMLCSATLASLVTAIWLTSCIVRDYRLWLSNFIRATCEKHRQAQVV